MPPVPWLVVVFISVVGTLIADNLPDAAGVALEASAAAFGIALALTFAGWYRSERTLSIHTIVTARRERSYLRYGLDAVLVFRPACIFTRPLGASIGDGLSQRRHDGSLGTGTTGMTALFLAIILAVVACPTVARRDVNEVLPG